MSQLPDGRFVDDAPYDPQQSIRELERKDLDAPNWVLVWRKFRTHKLGLISGIFLLLCYLMLPFAGFLAPYGPNYRHSEHLYSPPQSIKMWHEGEFIGPFWGRVVFHLGLLGMLLTTITLHMVCAGFAASEMFGWRFGSLRYRLALLLPTPGVLGSVFWSDLSVWVAVPTSILAGFLLPLAYIGFVKLQRSDAYLGEDRSA